MEADMKVWMGPAGVAWIVAGAFVLRHALELTTSAVSVLHQQYVMGQFLLGGMLASFGTLFIGVADVIEAMERRRPAQRVTTRERAPSQRAAGEGAAVRSRDADA
jgi:hypothetical protein